MPKSKRPVGRPKVPDRFRKSEKVNVLLTKSELAKVERKSRQSPERSISGWIRSVVLEAL